MRIQQHVCLAPLTTLQLGGTASQFLDAGSEEDVETAVQQMDSLQERIFVIGGGSNVVVSDQGFDGLVLRPTLSGMHLSRLKNTIFVDVAAGEVWDSVVDEAVAQGGAGIECLSGIPGWVGASPVQNIGAYGQEIAQVLVRVRAFDREEKKWVWIEKRECQFSYRTSIFKKSDRYVITRVRLSLMASATRESEPISYPELTQILGISKGARAPLEAVREAVIELRRSKGMILDAHDPDSVGAGSFFMNPIVTSEELAQLERKAYEQKELPFSHPLPHFEADGGRWKIPAAWLIEHSGFSRGFGMQHVGISRKHCLALVHRGGGTTKELLLLADQIQQGVWQKWGVWLMFEPVLVGFS
ncbi:UDP-N-acetylmuramate dehydrogenase [Pajaroellobacter abortibovis]|uniref:UDP-N-acetylenolpyruvoylglucosamine reductase n=1 Tax=Pajaroellobacter abortibovis TaxID=1882918 RepID=A0A1L6MVZ4_9BACT|nr:UDP-N-acetylmuramate dehydrogenase [Pajaroellobacter abortibovis]APR99608.1 UDP-N-acetylenolpyruvoylglucosamine reductase [Pajaroellobacter abortibovis]